MDYNRLFEQEIFKTIDKNILDNFKILISNINCKNREEKMVYIIDFFNNLPKDINLSKEQVNAIIRTICLNMSVNERQNLLNMLDVISNFV